MFDRKGREVTPRGRKARAILAYLSAHPGLRVPRERLMGLLWGDRGQSQARDSLRHALFEIRRSARELIHADGDHLWVDPHQFSEDAPDASTDVQPFDDLNHLTAEFDDWLALERQRRSMRAWDELKAEVESLLADDRGASALPLIERMRQIDPYNEDWLRLAMRAEFQAEHPAGIEQRFKDMEQVLRRDLGVAPAPETRALHDRLLGKLARPTSIEAPAPLPLPQRLLTRSAQAVSRSGRLDKLWPGLAAGVMILATLGLSQSAPTASDQPRIAVLPFQAMEGADPVLAEGIAGEVLSHLSQHPGVETVGRTSSWVFKDKPEDLRRVGQRLDVDYVIEGGVREVGDVVGATISLVDTRDGSIVWSGRWRSGNAQRIEQAATAAILRRLGVQQAHSVPQADPRVYALYIRAKSIIRQRNLAEMPRAQLLLAEALRRDPKFAPAWAQLAGLINFVGIWQKNPPPDWRDRALAAAHRAIKLDPKLAEGHQMLAFIYGFSTPEARAHLSHALQLDPDNPQSLYWWANIAERAGNYDLAERAARASLAQDPLWQRPAEVVAHYAIERGRKAVADAIVARLKDSDRNSAVTVEMTAAKIAGDLSRVVEIGRARDNAAVIASTPAVSTLSDTLRELGFVREALLVAYAPPFERSLYLRQLPDMRTILRETQEVSGTDDEVWRLRPLVLELARTGRYAEIAALVDRKGSVFASLRDVQDQNRLYRHLINAFLGEALARQGRAAEASRYFRGVDESQRVILKNSLVPKETLAEMALNEAIRGRSERSLDLLEEAVARGWLALEGSDYRLTDLPWFARMKGNPRFDRLLATVNARLERERRETRALGVI